MVREYSDGGGLGSLTANISFRKLSVGTGVESERGVFERSRNRSKAFLTRTVGAGEGNDEEEDKLDSMQHWQHQPGLGNCQGSLGQASVASKRKNLLPAVVSAHVPDIQRQIRDADITRHWMTFHKDLRPFGRP